MAVIAAIQPQRSQNREQTYIIVNVSISEKREGYTHQQSQDIFAINSIAEHPQHNR